MIDLKKQFIRTNQEMFDSFCEEEYNLIERSNNYKRPSSGGLFQW